MEGVCVSYQQIPISLSIFFFNFYLSKAVFVFCLVTVCWHLKKMGFNAAGVNGEQTM